MSLFEIMGPIMVGPSSSHTAGAVRIGAMARRLLDDKPIRANIFLHGSFAATGVGHGTKQALIAGLLGMKPDDERIPRSFELTEEAGLSFTFDTKELRGAHPNSVLIHLLGKEGTQISMEAASLGGGRISINKLDGVEVEFSGDYNTLVVYNEDRPGCVVSVAELLAKDAVNIADMTLFRERRGGRAVMIIETDQTIPEKAVLAIRTVPGIIKVTCCNREDI
ncbi:MAG: L-serine ammonia-lyase, iron-sulfur-dependent subunit beta [Oscillospiraceae bacterium]